MRQACDNYELGIEQKDRTLCVESDLLFHKLLVEASGSKRLVKILESFHIQSTSIVERGDKYWDRASAYLSKDHTILDLVSESKGEVADRKIRQRICKRKEIALSTKNRGRTNYGRQIWSKIS